MRRRPRLLRVTKWAGTAACVLCILAFLVSVNRLVELWLFGKAFIFSLYRGMLGLSWYVGRTGWHSELFIHEPRRHVILWWPYFDWSEDGFVYVPWWMILAVVSVPTAYLWLLDRRRPPPGHCPCGYDLRGNESGTCPECGRPSGAAPPRSEGVVSRVQRIARERDDTDA